MKSSTTNYICYCGCGEVVSVKFVADTIEVARCSSSTYPTYIVGAVFDRSFALQMQLAKAGA